ncbi:unnamed protein product, partial [Bubo scandiacus]
MVFQLRHFAVGSLLLICKCSIGHQGLGAGPDHSHVRRSNGGHLLARQARQGKAVL